MILVFAECVQSDSCHMALNYWCCEYWYWRGLEMEYYIDCSRH